MQLLAFILACYGCTMIAVYGKIFDAIRPQHHFFKCPMCMGFHVGWFVALIMKLSNLASVNANFIDVFMLACLSSGTSYVLCSLFTDFGINFKINKE